MNLRCVNKFLSRRISLSGSCPESREGLDVIQLRAVMIGWPVRCGRAVAEARSLSLCTLGRSFMYGNWNLVKVEVVRRCFFVDALYNLLKHLLSLGNSLLELEIVVERLKLSMCR